jgi:hypothetical protein
MGLAPSADRYLAIASVCPLVVGAILATTGNSFALGERDRIVSAAQGSEITAAYQQDERVRAALLDSGGNIEAALVTSVTGLAVVGPAAIAAYRGWVGGLVSADARHVSRLGQSGTAFYYLVTVALQMIPYILTGGAGMYLGLVAWRRRNDASVRSFLRRFLNRPRVPGRPNLELLGVVRIAGTPPLPNGRRARYGRSRGYLNE